MVFNFNYDITNPFTIALAAFSSIISSLTTTVFTSWHQGENKKREIIDDKKINALEDFSKSYGKWGNYTSAPHSTEFVSNAYKLFSFTSSQTTHEILSLVAMVQKGTNEYFVEGPPSKKTNKQFLKCLKEAQKDLGVEPKNK